MVDSTINDPNVKDISNCIKARYDAGIENQRSVGTAVIEPVICRSIGRDPDNPSNREKGCNTEQRLELNTQGLSNTLTLVQKDNYVVEPVNQYDDGTARTIKSQYYKNSIANFDKTGTYGATGVCKIDNHGIKIRKLTPRECWRLMGFSDEEFDKIKGISNTQLYKMAGNSIVVNVLEAIFKQLFKESHK